MDKELGDQNGMDEQKPEQEQTDQDMQDSQQQLGKNQNQKASAKQKSTSGLCIMMVSPNNSLLEHVRKLAPRPCHPRFDRFDADPQLPTRFGLVEVAKDGQQKRFFQLAGKFGDRGRQRALAFVTKQLVFCARALVCNIGRFANQPDPEKQSAHLHFARVVTAFVERDGLQPGTKRASRVVSRQRQPCRHIGLLQQIVGVGIVAYISPDEAI